MSHLIDPELFRRVAAGSPAYMRAVSHPDLEAIRSGVVKSLTAEIDAALLPLAYERNGAAWRKSSRFGRGILQLQKSTYGFGLYINAGRASHVQLLTPSAFAGPEGFIYTRLAKFCPELDQRTYQIDELYYLNFHDSVAFKDAVMTVVQARLIPWIEQRHKPSSLFRLSTPEAMATTPLFQ